MSKIKIQQLCRDFLVLYAGGEEWDAQHASIMIREMWGIEVDWHEFVTAFETLVFWKRAQLTQGWGNCKYMVNEPKRNMTNAGG